MRFRLLQINFKNKLNFFIKQSGENERKTCCIQGYKKKKGALIRQFLYHKVSIKPSLKEEGKGMCVYLYISNNAIIVML